MSPTKTNLLLVGCSHFSRKSHFMQIMSTVFTSPELKELGISSHPRGYMKQSKVNEIKKAVRKYDRDQQVIVFVMLSNHGVRLNPDKHEMLKNHEYFITEMNKFANVKLIISGSIPCPLQHSWTDQAFKKLDKELFELTEKWAIKCLFFDAARLFFNRLGLKTFLFRDQEYLTNEGSHLLAMSMYSFIHDVALPRWCAPSKPIIPVSISMSTLPHPLISVQSSVGCFRT